MAVGSILPIFEVSQAQASAPGNFYGWGRNDHGQLGSGNFTEFHAPERLPAAPGGVADWNELYLRVIGHSGQGITPNGELWVWGRNLQGQLGLGDIINRDTPVQNTNLPSGLANWNYVEWIHSGYHNFVRPLVLNANDELVPDGRLFGWGFNTDGRLGLNHTNLVTTPTPIPMPATMTAIPGVNNWGDVEFIEAALELSNGFTLVRTPNGQLFGWGRNLEGSIGLNHTNPVNVPTNIPMPAAMAAIPSVNNWNDVEIFQGTFATFARTPNGQLFVWGINTQGALGLNHTNPVNTPTLNNNLPPGVANWNEIERFQFQSNGVFAFTADGRKFATGFNGHGNFGLGNNDALTTFTPIPLSILPSLPNVSSWNDLDLIIGSHHTFAITPTGRMFTWGRNVEGNLGLGHNTTPVNTPTENTNLPQGVRDWRDLELFVGGHDHVFARVLPLAPIPITKTLRLNEGTIVPGTEMPTNTPAGKVSGEATFTFRFVQRPQVRINDDPIRYSHANVPAIANQTITIDPNTATAPVNGVFTATGNTVCIRALVYAHNPFPAGSVFVWEVYEVLNSSGLHDYPCVQVVYDTSRYQIRAYSNSAGIIEIIEVFEMERIGNNWQIVLPKLGATPFTNIYTRLVGDEGLPLHNALLISKEVEGMYADLTTQFDFTLTLTNPALTPPVVGDGTTGPVIAQVVQSGTTTPVSPARTVAIALGENTFFLRHNESLLIPQLPAGTSFTITEDAHIQFQPRATVTAIPIPPATGTYPMQNANTDLETGTYIIHQVNNNTAAFTNVHLWDIPTGLFITSTPWVALGAAALLAGLLATSRNRRRIEELPMVL